MLDEISSKESEYSCNQLGSRVIENLLLFSNDEAFVKFLNSFSINLRPLFCDKFGSHVLEQTVVVSFMKYKKNVEGEENKKLSLEFYNYILKVANFLFNNIEDFIWDVHSNPVARTVFNVLSGYPVKGDVQSLGSDIKEESNFKVPAEFTAVLKKFCLKILSHPQFSDFCNQPLNSSFLQSLLIAVRKLEENSNMIDKIIGIYESHPLELLDENNLPYLRLLEVVLSVSNKQQWKKVYKLVFKDKIVDMAKSNFGNISVQKLIDSCKSKKTFGIIFTSLESHMKEILVEEKSGVLVAVVKACQTLGICQGGCMTVSFKLKVIYT